MRLTAWMLAAACLAGCTVTLEGAPCYTDANCPGTQHCGREGKCEQGPVPEDLACERAALTLSERTSECLGGPAELWRAYQDVRTLCAAVVAGVKAGRIEYDPMKLEACQQTLRAYRCDDLSADDILVGCAAFNPKQTFGDRCGTSLDCIDGWCDTRTLCPGNCRPIKRLGTTCDASQDRCEKHSRCAGFPSTCGPYPTACNLFSYCDVSRSYCDASGMCAPKATSGACEPSVVYQPCAPRYTCAGPSGGAHACQPAKGEGEPCTPGNNECQILLYCSPGPDSRCTRQPLVGQTCGYHGGEIAYCLNGWCESNTVCRAPLEPGSVCTNAEQCGRWGECRPSDDPMVKVCRATVCG